MDENKQEWFATVRWHEDDIRAGLIEEGFEPTRDAIDYIRFRMENRGFAEMLIAHGWDLIDQYIDDCAEDLEEVEDN